MAGSHPRRPRTTVIVMVLLSFTVLTLSSKDVPVLGSIRSTIIDATGPIGRGFRTATKPVRNWWGGVNDYERIEQENEKLREEIDRLKAKQIRNANAAAELERLKEQAGIPTTEEIPAVLAQVATGPYSNFDNNTILIDRGASSGFKVGMPVVTSLGLVGSLESVTEDRAVVRLITDPEFAVSVKRAATGSYAIGHGAGAHNPFVVDQNVGLEQKVEKGEVIVTSGISSAKFPKDLIIGTVDKVSRSQSDLTQVLDIDLAADFVRLNYVSVLLWEPPQ